MIAALYNGKKLFTGTHHGDAFSKMSEEEKASTIQSGFVDPTTRKFVCDDCQFYLKKIIMIRHGDSEGCWDSPITSLGRSQTMKAAAFLLKNNLSGFYGLCSPTRRCIQTAFILEQKCQLSFSVDERLSKQYSFEDNESFFYRIEKLLDTLPEKSILISHCDFIQNMIHIALGHETVPQFIPNCSATYIEDQKAIWVARNIVGEYDAKS